LEAGGSPTKPSSLAYHRITSSASPRSIPAVIMVGFIVFSLRAAVMLHLSVVPGRPTYTPNLTAFNSLSAFLALAMGLFVAAYGYINRNVWLLAGGFAGVASSLIKGSSGGVAGAAASILVLLAGGWMEAGASLAGLAAASASIIAAGRLTGSLPLEGLGWALPLYMTVLGFIVGFAAAVASLTAPSRLLSYNGVGGGNRGGGYTGLYLLGLAIISAVTTVIAPRLVLGHGIYSLDTMYNLRFCHRLSSGDYTVLLSWRRPLYVLAFTLPAAHAGCPYWFYDIVIPLAGFTLLAVTVYLLALRDGLPSLWAGLASLASILFWVPFFSYAGLQTNLLILPLVLALYRATIRGWMGWPLPAGWLVVGLFHPWTLAFATAAMAFNLLAVRPNDGRLWERLLRRLLVVLPGWVGYGVVELLARGFSVGNVARSVFTVHPNYIMTLKIYFWGTSIRGEVILPAALLLAFMALGRPTLRRGMEWVLGPAMAAFLLAPLPNATLIPRYLVDSTLPILLVYGLYNISGRLGRAVALALLAAECAVYAVLISHTAPVAPPPR
jgi:hypothetical protein